ncbi:MAG TPA: non-ribosomal peptide synthetase, partial [Candidatus Elarobacter sp.]|nr:non-ribosomal peptide synthetase [Candidatus Elarobacter sp.]
GLAALPIVAPSQREQLFALLRGPDRPVRDRCIDELVRQRSAQQPDATAVICGEERISYAELERAAERLAQRLRKTGATRDTLVAVLCEPSIAMIVAVLAVLKAGAAYLPLDARYPPERLRSVIDDAQPVVALTDAQHAARLAGSVKTLAIDGDAASADDGAAPPVIRDASDLAYVIYTSGTTGEPKGVEVEHRSVVAYLDAVIYAYGLGANDVVLQFTSLSFDTSVQDIFATLVAGATLAVATPGMRVSPVELMHGCARLGVTLFDLPAAYWHLLVDDVVAGRARIPPALRLAIVGGEAMAPAAARAWLERSGVRLINAYGPTETTISATMHDIGAVDAAAITVPVGRALPHVHLYLLDAARAPVARGAIGQLYVGGAGVARGYRRRPELTARAFVPDLARDGTRMYATGDLARIDGDGLLHIIGRDDGQVKIRGFRVETGEIEAVLLRHAAVRAGAVVVHEDAAGTRRLVAHVVPVDGSTVDVAALETHLRASLPDYMIPAIAPIAALPLTVGGKLDRAALPGPRAAAMRTERAVEPCDDLERALVTLWEELLDRAPIGVRDNFFALGGHSLLAARMATLVERRLGTRLPVASLFAAQTIEEVATLLRRGTDGELRAVLQLQAGDARTPLYFLHGDYEGGGLYCTRLAEGLGRDQSLFVVRPHGYDDGPNVPPIET